MLPPRSQFARSQVSAVLFYARTAKFVAIRAQICWRYACFSSIQGKGRQHHLGQNIGPAIAGSARPGPPALSERNEPVKETVPLNHSARFKVQISNAYGKSGVVQAVPTALLSTVMTSM